MSYQMRISPRARQAGRFIMSVHREIQRAFSRSKLTQQELATKLDVNRATINKRLLGEENLTLRSIADLGWSLDLEPHFELRARQYGDRQNYMRDRPTTDSQRITSSGTMYAVNGAAPTNRAVAADV